jgi:hypothetical protein
MQYHPVYFLGSGREPRAILLAVSIVVSVDAGKFRLFKFPMSANHAVCR